MSTSKTTKPTLGEPLQSLLTTATDAATAQKEGADSAEATAVLKTKVTKEGKTTKTANAAKVAFASKTETVDAEASCLDEDCGTAGAKAPAKS